MRAIIENKISPDYVLCCIPRVLEVIGKKVKILAILYYKAGHVNEFNKAKCWHVTC